MTTDRTLLHHVTGHHPWLGGARTSTKMIEEIRRLRSTHTPIWWNPNNFAPTLQLQGRIVPDVLEVAFVRNDVFKSGSMRADRGMGGLNNPQGPVLLEPFSIAPRNPYGTSGF